MDKAFSCSWKSRWRCCASASGGWGR